MSSNSEALRYGLAGLVSMVAAMGIGRFVYTPILPGMMEGLGLSAAQAGQIASANYLGYLVGALLAAGGWAHGRERVLTIAALAANALLLGCMAVWDALWAQLAVRFLAGLASAFVMVFLGQIVFSRTAAAGRPGLSGLLFIGVGTGIAMSGVMTGGLHLAEAGWRAAWWGAAMLAAVAVVAMPLLAPQGPVVTAGAETREGPLPPSTPLRKITLAYGIFGAGYIVTATFLVAIVRQDHGDPLFESAVWLVTGLAVAPSLWLWGMAARRLGVAGAFAAGCIVEAAGVAASVLMPPPAGPLVGGLFLGGTFVAITAYGLQLGRALAPAAQRRVLAVMTAAFGTGQILAPIAAGYAAEWTGSFLVPSLGAALALLASAWIGWSARR